jgi:hypothetical protein
MHRTPSCCVTVDRMGYGEIVDIMIANPSFSALADEKSVVCAYSTTLPREIREDKGTEVMNRSPEARETLETSRNRRGDLE